MKRQASKHVFDSLEDNGVAQIGEFLDRTTTYLILNKSDFVQHLDKTISWKEFVSDVCVLVGKITPGGEVDNALKATLVESEA